MVAVRRQSGIFVSYRRSDRGDLVGRLYDRLEQHFGSARVFMDVDDIPPGTDFVEHIETRLDRCGIVLAFIGERWVQELKDREGEVQGGPHEPDFVRFELERALARDAVVLPVLLGDAAVPPASVLPESLRRLATLQAARVRPGADFRQDGANLISAIERVSVDQPEPPGGRRTWRTFRTAAIVLGVLAIGGAAASYAFLFRETEATGARRADAAMQCNQLFRQALDRYAHDDGREAGRLFRQSADCGNDLATMWVARGYHRGLMNYSQDDQQSARLAARVFDAVQRQAAGGSPDAEFLVGSAYFDGLVVKRSPAEGLPWLRRAAQHGNPLAQWNLGLLLLQGEVIKADAAEGEKLVRAAANGGVAVAARELATRRYEAADYPAAFEWFQKAATAGHTPAIVQVGNMLADGRGVARPDACEACKWYQKAARLGVAEGQVNVGLCYQRGVACEVDGVRAFEKDPCEAKQWFFEAAQKSNVHGLYNLGAALLRGDCRPTEGDEQQGKSYLKRAADAGFAPARDALKRINKRSKH